MTDARRSLRYHLRHSKDKYPTYLEKLFPHVTARIEELWDDPPAVAEYFHELLIPSRANRQGFPPLVAAEIFGLSSAYAAIRRKNAEMRSDPWEHERAVKELEELGVAMTPHNFAKAISEGNQELCLLFVSAGFDIESRDSREWTPLMIASFNGKEEIALLLIEQGANIRAEDRGGYAPMHWAAYNGYDRVIRLLLSVGGKSNVLSRAGISPVLQAAARGHHAACAELIKGGADVNIAANDGTTPLIKAVSNSHLAVVKLLLENGALLDAVMKDGTSLLDIAGRARDFSVRDCIRNYKAPESPR